MGARVTILDRDLDRLRALDQQYGAQINTVYATESGLEEALERAHVVIGAVLVPGAEAPKVVRREHLGLMSPGSVLVDVSIDQGGCFETSQITTHDNPTYVTDDIVHYCVANMPGAVPRTSAYALNHATLPFVGALAQKGVHAALREDTHFCQGLNVMHGQVTHPQVAESLGLPFVPPAEVLGI